MSLFGIIAFLITLTAVFSFLNHRYIKLPTTMGVMLIALLLSVSIIALNALGLEMESKAREFLESIHFDETFLRGMLSFLLFAGALHINLGNLLKQKEIITLLATAGVAISIALIGFITYFILGQIEIKIPLIYCLLFGAIISPTDPIAVLSILKHVGVPKSLETKISGESLFNDGVGVVFFILFLELATGGKDISGQAIASLFIKEALGGICLGLLLGFIAYMMLKSVNNYQVEILITLALVAGGFAMADAMHTSGPLAIVVAGLLIGNHGRLLAMSKKTREHLDLFWELLDEILNAVLFVLIGLEVLALTFKGDYFLAGLLAIPIALFSRFVSIGIPVSFMKPFRTFSPNIVKILAWGGLRGGISVALALSLPRDEFRDVILFMTYFVVIFSILVQGLTVEALVRRSVTEKR